MSANDFFTNRITRAIDAVEAKLADLDPAKVANIEAAATMSTEEFLAFGPIPSELLAMGVLDVDSANTLHAIHGDFDNSSLAARVVFMQAMGEALAAKVGA